MSNRYYINTEMNIYCGDELNTVYFPEKSVILQVNSSGSDLLFRMKDEGVIPSENNLQFLDTLFDLELIGKSVQVKQEKSCCRESSEKYDFRSLTLFLTEKCNLSCRYCYAQGGTGRRTMDYNTAKAAIDFMADHCMQNDFDFHVAYHGSGEPTSAYGLLEKTFNRCRQRADENNLELYFSIGTNGVMTDAARNLLIDNEFDISLSLDGPEHVHNQLRPMPGGNSFKEAMKTAYTFSDNDIPFSVRTTVTDLNCREMSDLVSFLFKNTNCEIVQLEPVYMTGRALETGINPPDIDLFIEKYFECLELADKFDRNVSYSGIVYPSKRNFFCQACGQSICVKVDGTLTGCYESADSETDPFCFGKIDSSHAVNIDRERYLSLNDYSFKRDECSLCNAYHHCGGDCPSKMTQSGCNDNYRCSVNRKILEQYLILHLEKSGQGCIKFN